MNLNIRIHKKGRYHNLLPKTILAEVIMTTELPGEKMINDQKNAMMTTNQTRRKTLPRNRDHITMT
jgi:hypothetical protein